VRLAHAHANGITYGDSYVYADINAYSYGAAYAYGYSHGHSYADADRDALAYADSEWNALHWLLPGARRVCRLRQPRSYSDS
jgi:hypothetical protein